MTAAKLETPTPFDTIKDKLESITQDAGCICNVTDVVEGKKQVRPRGVCVVTQGDGFELHINAEGVTLSAIRQYAAAVLGDEFSIDLGKPPKDETSPLPPVKVTTKRSPQKDKSDATT